MTVPLNDRRMTPYPGNDVATDFDFDFYVPTSDGLQVILVDSFDVQALQVYGTDYTIEGLGSESGGTVVFTTPPATGFDVYLIGNTPLTQPTDFKNQSSYQGIKQERGLDRSTIQLQELAEKALLSSDPITQAYDANGRDIEDIGAAYVDSLFIDGIEVVPTGMAYSLPDPTGNQLELVRVNSSGTAYETKTRFELGLPIIVPTVAAMKALTGLADGALIIPFCRDHIFDNSNPPDYRYSTSPVTENGGTLFSQDVGGGGFSAVHDNKLSVKWFGAVGDGSTNDYTAIQNTINATPSGGTVRVPYGIYITGSRLDIVQPITIEGDGWGSVIKGDAGGNHIIIYSNNVSGINGVFLKNFKVDGNNGGQLDSGLIQLATANFGVENVWVTGTNKVSGSSAVDGMAFSSISGLEGTYGQGYIKNCLVNYVSKAGIYVSSYCYNVTIEGNRSHNNSGNGYATGISVVGKNTKVINNTCYANEGNGIFVASTSIPTTSDRAIIIGNHCFGNGTGVNEGSGISIVTSFGTNYGRIIVDSNHCYNNGITSSSPGIYVNNEDNIILTNNYVYLNGTFGIRIQDSRNTVVTENIVESNNQKNLSDVAGISLDGTCSKIKVKNNVSTDSKMSKTQKYGVGFFSGTLTDIDVKDNDCDGNATGDIFWGVQPLRLNFEHMYVHTTTNATPTNVLLIAAANDSVYSLNVHSVAIEAGGASDGAANWQLSGTIWNDGGTVAQIGATTTIASHLSANATTESWATTIDDNGSTSIRVRNTGSASSTIKWKTKVAITSVN